MPDVKVRLLRNVTLAIGDVVFTLPVKMKSVPVPGAPWQQVTMPVMDVAHVFSIPVVDATPRVPKRRPEWTDSFHEKVVDAALSAAIQARAAQEDLRQRILHFVRNGTLEVVEDATGLLDSEETLDPAELTVAAEVLDKAKPAKVKS